MTEVSTEPEPVVMPNEPKAKPAKKAGTSKPRAKQRPRTKPKGYPELAALVDQWRPSDPKLIRSSLVQELQTMLEDGQYACIKSCVPALIADGKYPIEVMHFRHKDDIDEFVARMVWMHEVFSSAIGVLVGVPDQETSDLVMNVCGALLKMDQDCTVLIL